MNRVVECGMRAACVAFVLFVPSLAAAQANGHLQVHYLNVGQGDAALIVSPLGQTLLIDSGPSSASNCASATGIISQLTAIGVTRLDYHVASHYDADHIGCSDVVVGHWPVQHAVYDRGTASLPSTQTYARYAAAVANKRQTVTVGQQIVLDAGAAVPVIFQVVAVNGNGTAGSLSENDRSIVLVLHFGSFDAEFGGDLAGENSNGNHNVESLIASAVGQVEAYKVHHHGSATSSNAAWMSAIHPKVAILSVGSPNAFDHPTQAALDRIHASGAVTYWTTAGDGAPAVSAFDVVANGAIVVDVPTAGTTFTVSHGGVFEAFPSWGTACCTRIAPTSATVPAAGGTGRVTVTTGSGCWWSAWSIDSAITVTIGGAGSDGGTVDYTVAANTSTVFQDRDDRDRGVHLHDHTGRRIAAAAAAAVQLGIARHVDHVAAASSTGTISVAAPGGCAWTAAWGAIFARSPAAPAVPDPGR